MKTLRRKLSAVAIATLASKSAQATDLNQRDILESVQPGVYYHLTPQAASALKIDVAYLIDAIKLRKSQQLAFQLKEDGELDLAIYKNGVFAEVRKDIIKQAIRQ